MIFLLTLLIVIVLVLYGLQIHFEIKLGMKPQRTPEATVAYIAQLLERSAESGLMLNLSSGYGGAVFELAKRLPAWEITGVERSPTPWIVANMRSIGKNYGNYRFFLKDPLQWPLRDYNVIFLNQSPKIIKQWEATLARRLQPGTLFITYNAPLPRIKPIEVITVNPTAKLYIYKKPIPTDGTLQQTLPVEDVSPVAQAAAAAAIIEEITPVETVTPVPLEPEQPL